MRVDEGRHGTRMSLIRLRSNVRDWDTTLLIRTGCSDMAQVLVVDTRIWSHTPVPDWSVAIEKGDVTLEGSPR
jgi:hypothetical protein